MNNYQDRIFKALEFIDNNSTRLIKERDILKTKLLNLESENKKLKDTTKSVISELENYIEEMERIKKDYVSRNNNN